jgi:hypothetical protein
MAHESFEDKMVAEVLNSGFISIKVDREERPDIDQIYMKVCQIMTGQGGWPLTILMTPEKHPFFAGTYIPKEARFGTPGLLDLLGEYARLWRVDRKSLLELSKKASLSIQAHPGVGHSEMLTRETLDIAFEEFSLSFDEEHGGFGSAPKFPSPHNLLFLLRYWDSTKSARALGMVERTLSSMHRGGIYDHIGFGFFRYSVDERWLVPHFEKMLYDNALLAYAYLEAYQATGKGEYEEVAREILDYVEWDMRSPDGAFCSAEDADSEGVEGKFYLWNAAEIIGCLGDDLGKLACEIFGIDAQAVDAAVPNLVGASFEELARTHGLSEEELRRSYAVIRSRLFSTREKRAHPLKDDKILTSWNGLMIAAFSKGAIVLGNAHYAELASGAADFVLGKLTGIDGRLMARYRDGEVAYLAYLDDYAFLVWGLLELYEATFNAKYLRCAMQLNSGMIDIFWDPEGGGFYFTGNDGEALIARPKEVYDGSMPSGNSVAALNLLRISQLSEDERVSRIAEAQLSHFSGALANYPSAHAFFLLALLYSLGPATKIVVSGNREEEGFKAMINVIRSKYLPRSTVLFNPPRQESTGLEQLVPLLRDKTQIDGKATATVCSNYACRRPTTDPTELESMLNADMALKK